MVAVLNMPESLLALTQTHLQQHRVTEALRVLRRLLNFPDLPPSIAAKANLLLARIHFNQADYEEACVNLGEALSADPENAESHYLLAQSSEQNVETQEESIDHFERAAALAPHDGRMVSAYGRRLVTSGESTKGIELLTEAYREHASDPRVVENVVEALMDADRVDDAELVVRQTSYRYHTDRRFEDLRHRFENRRRETMLARSSRRSSPNARSSSRRGSQPESSAYLLPFRSFESPPPGKPRSPKRPAHGGARRTATSHEASAGSSDAAFATDWTAAVPVLDGDMELKDVLKKMGRQVTAQVYQGLGLLGKARPQDQRAEISAVLLRRAFLNSLVKRLPAESRKLLRSLVRLGGLAPASVLFQNTGPDAPPPDYVQPLLSSGLLFFGSAPRRQKSEQGLLAVIPADLLLRLATVLRIPLEND